MFVECEVNAILGRFVFVFQACCAEMQGLETFCSKMLKHKIDIVDADVCSWAYPFGSMKFKKLDKNSQAHCLPSRFPNGYNLWNLGKIEKLEKPPQALSLRSRFGFCRCSFSYAAVLCCSNELIIECVCIGLASNHTHAVHTTTPDESAGCFQFRMEKSE